MSRIVKILGTGCSKCKQTTAIVEDVVAANNIDATIEKVEDIMDIMKYNVMSTPAVVIDEKVVIKGRVPLRSELVEIFKN